MNASWLALPLLLVGLAHAAPDGPQPTPLTYVPLMTTRVPEGPDLLTAPLWDAAAWLGPFVRADARAMPDAETTARVARTEHALLLLVHCAEPRMDRIVATQTRRDATVWVDDCIEVFVQPPGEAYRHFIVNSLGTPYDEREKDGTWNAEWQVSARALDSAWEVALVLPWASLGGAPVEGDEWGFNVCRCRQAEPELSQWSPTVEGFHKPEAFGRIGFGDCPWPVRVHWDLPARTEGRVRIDWQPEGVGPSVALRVNGVETAGAFALPGEGAVPLLCEALAGGVPVFRALYIAAVTPLQGALDAARALVGALPESLGPRRAALAAELDHLARLADETPPAMASDLMSHVQRVGLNASHLAVLAAVPEGSIAYGIETSLTKLLRHEPFRGQAGGTLTLDAARREMDARQVVLFAGERPLLRVSAELTKVTSEAGIALPEDAFRIRQVGYVPTVKPSYAVDHVGLWPDPLMPFERLDVREGGFESLWIDVRVPADAAPGLYRGQLILAAQNASQTAVPVEVRVRRFTIPQAPSVRTAFGLGPGGWRVPQDADAYTRNALEHRISPYTVGAPRLVSPPAMNWEGAERIEVDLHAAGSGILRLAVTPVDGSPVLLDPQPVQAPEMHVTFDVSSVPAQVLSWRLELEAPEVAEAAKATVRLVRGDGTETLIEDRESRRVLGPDGWLESWAHWEGSAWEDPDVPGVWDWSDFDQQVSTYLPLGLTGHVVGLSDPRSAWAREWQAHLQENGWAHLGYTYLFDEPTPDRYPLLNDVMGEVKRAAPGLMNMMTAREFPPELRYVDIWCPEAYSFDPEAARAEQVKGKAVWWYVAFSTRHPYPNVWVDYPALDCRVWPWMTWKHDLDGMLYWSAVYWFRNDPWRCAETFPGANGDGSLLYPGDDGKPVDSIRWECLRDGLEDYEVLALLDAGAAELVAAGGNDTLAARARELAAIPDDVVRSYRDYNPDPAALLAARAEMSDVLEQVVRALGHEPAIVGRPRYRPGVDLARVAAEDPSAKRVEPVTWGMPEARPEPGLVLRYSFDDTAPIAVDLSGRGMHGMVRGAKRAEGVVGQGLAVDGAASVELPGCSGILGSRPEQGTIALWVRPEFDASELSGDLWQGYRVIVYLMKTDGNGLPDGSDEIGLYVHGDELLARCGGGDDVLFARVPTPLHRGRWSHLGLTWTPDRRTLYVDGQPAEKREGAYVVPSLDGFAGRLGLHPASGAWPWLGSFDEVRIYDRALTQEEVGRLAAR